MAAVQNYTDLRCWQLAMELAELVFRLTGSFPSEEQFGLTSQLRRSAVSVASNIAEGQGRDSRREFLRFLSIARGSVQELETQLTLAHRLGWLDTTSFERMTKLIVEIRKILHGLCSYLRKKSAKHPRSLSENSS